MLFGSVNKFMKSKICMSMVRTQSKEDGYFLGRGREIDGRGMHRKVKCMWKLEFLMVSGESPGVYYLTLFCMCKMLLKKIKRKIKLQLYNPCPGHCLLCPEMISVSVNLHVFLREPQKCAHLLVPLSCRLVPTPPSGSRWILLLCSWGLRLPSSLQHFVTLQLVY